MTRLHRPVSIPGLLGSTVEGGTPLVLTPEGVVALGTSGGGGGELPDGNNPDDLLVWDGAQWLPAPPGGPPLSDIYLKIGDIEDVPPGNAPNDILVWTGTAWSAVDPADPPLSSIYLKTSDYTPPTFLHEDLTDVTPDQHHPRYTDAEAISAVGPHFSGNHADLTNVLPDQHHVRYTDAEAIAAVGPHFSGDHDDLTNVTPDQHHTRYTDAEAIAAGDGIYLPLTGGTLTGFLTLNAAPTAPLHAATKQYVDDEIGGLPPIPDVTYREPMPTGVLSGGQMTNAGTVLTVAAGTGIIVNSWDDGFNINPTFTPVSWAEQTIDFGSVTDRQYSYPYIDSLGVLGFSTTPPQPNQLRSDIWLGRTPHDIATGNLLTPRPAHMLPGGTAQMFADLLYAVNVPFLFEGGKINPNPDLTFQTEDSRWFGPAESWQQDKDDPNIANNPGADPQPFYYLLSTGTAVGAERTLVDPANYESPLGTVAPIPGSANRATIQRLYSSISGLHLMEYGQRWYDNLEDAVNSLNVDNSLHVTNPYVLQANGTLLAYFIMEKGATDLSDGTDVVIVDPSGIPLGGGGGGAHTHDATYLRLDAGNDPMQAALSMGGNLINEVLDPVSAQDAATKFYVDQEIGALPPPFSGDHADLTNVLSDQHHPRYTDAEAIAAVGPHFSGDHDDLTNVLPDQHHPRYTDAEAIAAVGPHFSGDHGDLTNVLPDQHHARYTDAEAIAAVGPHFSGDHADLTNVLPDQHHARYTDAEAIVALGPTLANYLPLSGGVMTGFLTLNAAPTSPLHAATKQYVDDNTGGVTDHDDLTNVTSSQHHVRYDDSEALAAMGDLNDFNTYNHDRYTDAEAVDALQNTLALYLPLAGGLMSGPIDMGGNQVKNVADPTDLQDAVTRSYFEANDVGTVHTVSTSAPVNPSVGDVWVDPSALGENEYLRLIGGTMTGDINMSGGVGMFWPTGQGISDAFDSTLRLYSDTKEMVRISGSTMEMFGDLFMRGNIVDRPYMRADAGSAGLPPFANRAESNTGLYFDTGGRVNYAGQGAYALGFARSDFALIPSGSNPAIIRFGAANVGGNVATAAIESSWGTGSMPQIAIGVTRDAAQAKTTWAYDRSITHEVFSGSGTHRFKVGTTQINFNDEPSGAMVRISGANGASLAFFRNSLATKWRFAVGTGGFLLQKSTDNGTNWTTVETWT